MLACESLDRRLLTDGSGLASQPARLRLADGTGPAHTPRPMHSPGLAARQHERETQTDTLAGHEHYILPTPTKGSENPCQPQTPDPPSPTTSPQHFNVRPQHRHLSATPHQQCHSLNPSPATHPAPHLHRLQSIINPHHKHALITRPHQHLPCRHTALAHLAISEPGHPPNPSPGATSPHNAAGSSSSSSFAPQPGTNSALARFRAVTLAHAGASAFRQASHCDSASRSVSTNRNQ